MPCQECHETSATAVCPACYAALRGTARAEAFDRFREDAEEFLRDAAIADDHSSDVDPGTGRE